MANHVGVGYKKEQRLSVEVNQQDGARLAGLPIAGFYCFQVAPCVSAEMPGVQNHIKKRPLELAPRQRVRVPEAS